MSGYKLSQETREKISKALIGNTRAKGKIPWNKGLHTPWTDARREANRILIMKRGTKPTNVGGVDYHPEWRTIRKKIYERDNWTCKECGVKCHCNNSKDKIQCHHIDYNIENCELENLITLCASCHGKTRWNREDWIVNFQDKILEGSGRR